MANILVIDDQPSMRSFISQMLKDKGHQVSTAGDGEEGLKLFDQDPGSFDLVLADVNMPKIDGFEFLKEVKSNHPRTPVILLTGVNEDAAKYVGKEYKADGVIKKPFKVEETLAEIEKVISGSR
jgi:two-component system response regulator PilR (NtrC family)/two-component system response regulator HydG